MPLPATRLSATGGSAWLSSPQGTKFASSCVQGYDKWEGNDLAEGRLSQNMRNK